MEMPSVPVADDVKADLERFITMWSLFDDFNSGMEDMLQQDWISFRLE